MARLCLINADSLSFASKIVLTDLRYRDSRSTRFLRQRFELDPDSELADQFFLIDRHPAFDSSQKQFTANAAKL